MSYWTGDGTSIPGSEESPAESTTHSTVPSDSHTTSFQSWPDGRRVDSPAIYYESTTGPFYNARQSSQAYSAQEPFSSHDELEQFESWGSLRTLPGENSRYSQGLPFQPRQPNRLLSERAYLFDDSYPLTSRAPGAWDNSFNHGPSFLHHDNEQNVRRSISNMAPNSYFTYPSTASSIHSDSQTTYSSTFTNMDFIPRSVSPGSQTSLSSTANPTHYYRSASSSSQPEISNYTSAPLSSASKSTNRPLMAAAPTLVEDDPIQGPVSEPYNLHSNPEPYVCKHCDKSFRRSSALKKHAKTHDDESDRPYSCETCSRKFYYSKDLDRHKKTIHKDEYLSSGHSCKVCDRKFIRSDHLHQHYKTRHPDYHDMQ